MPGRSVLAQSSGLALLGAALLLGGAWAWLALPAFALLTAGEVGRIRARSHRRSEGSRPAP